MSTVSIGASAHRCVLNAYAAAMGQGKKLANLNSFVCNGDKIYFTRTIKKSDFALSLGQFMSFRSMSLLPLDIGVRWPLWIIFTRRLNII